MRGTDLEGVEYEPIFSELPIQQGFSHRIVLWKEVDPKEGTGVVHIAPGCGREDYELSTQVAIERLIPVDEKGEYVKGYGALEGKNAKTVANEVAEYLAKNGKLYSKYQHKHSYPVCWRCKDELIFRLVGEWYISSKEVRPKLIEAARTVKWQPEHVGKRMENWLENMGDWCISRKRFWGLPLPLYCCPSCETVTVVGSKEELQTLSPDDCSKIPELHRPWIDAVRIKCPKCATLVQRIPEVGDCWLDAGIVPYSTRGCYERGSEGKAEAWAPADWICEMSEQVRLWFYSMLFMGVTLGERAPYKHVLTYERVLAEDGTKFSKTGYMIKFDEAAEKMGVDTMRYYFASQAPTNDLRFGYSQGDEARRQLISLWNIYSFFMTYAELDKPSIDIKALANPEQLCSTDRWLLASIAELEREAKKGFEDFNTPAVVRAFEEFLEGVSNWYIRSNRRRFWKSESSTDKSTGYAALFYALRTAAVVMSPVMPFLSEKIWLTCVRKFGSASEPGSVHLAEWPGIPTTWAAPGIVKSVAHVRQTLNIALRLRSESKIKVRQPLSRLAIMASAEQEKSLREMESVILGELNVKALEFLKSKEEVFSEFLELDLKKSGPVLRGDVAKVVAIVNALTPAVTATLLPLIKDGKAVKLPEYEKELPAEIFVVKLKPRPNTISAEEAGIFVVLDTTVTKELEEEGWVRDVLRQIQVLRRESGLEVQDRIELTLTTSFSAAAAVFEKQRSAIEVETLGTVVTSLGSTSALGTAEAELSTLSGEDFKVSIALRKKQ
jgi:isoleucyl-tRNA synthetase